VLDAEAVVFVEGERVDLGPGDFAFAPRGSVHAYLVRSPRARMLVTLSPAGLDELFVSAGIPVTSPEPQAEGAVPPVGELAALFAEYGCELVGPPPLFDDL
jgi:hypothetical protein